jgi:hypothetical protein
MYESKSYRDFRSVFAWRKVTAWRLGPVWEDTNKIKLKEIEWNGVEWVSPFQDTDKRWAVQNIVINLRIP